MTHLIAILRELVNALTVFAILQKENLSLREVSLYTGLSESQLHKLTHKRKITFSKPGGKLIFILKADIDEYLLQNRQDSCKVIEMKAANYSLRKAS